MSVTSASLRALLAGVVDYAGLFPPAGLALDLALAHYVRYRQGPEGWMLGRFVCPAARLPELVSWHQHTRPPGPPIPVSAIGRGGSALPEFLSGLREDAEAILAFNNARPTAGVVEALEVRLPAELSHPDRARDLLDVVSGTGPLCAREGVRPAPAFFEVGYGSGWRAGVGGLLAALAQQPRPDKGLKVRCGGPTASTVPTPQDVAFALAACRDAGVPAKFTAGLHHPLRHHDAAVGGAVHGFVNVFAAGALAHARHLDAGQLRQVLEDEEPSHFRFDGEELRWRSLQVSTAEIAEARRQAVLSFGSCSFDEPREGLRALGWLE